MTAPHAPVLRQIVTNDATQERVAELMQQNPRGIALIRDELSGWFAAFNQYRPGADEEFYLQCHAGGGWNQDRKSGSIWIPDLFLNIYGGFQPEVVRQVLTRRTAGNGVKAVDNGMAARFSLLVWPEVRTGARSWVDRRLDRDTRSSLDRLFDRLLALEPERIVGPPRGKSLQYEPLRFTPGGAEVFREWWGAHQIMMTTLDPDNPLVGHFAKFDGLFARLSLVHHLIRHAADEPVEPAAIDAVTAVAVRDLIDNYLRPHAIKIYQLLGRGTAYHGAQRVAQWIASDRTMTSFLARDVVRKQWTGLTETREVKAALEYLENAAAWISTEEIPAGPRGGRPTTIYQVNPKVRKL